jgi:hypothetical protein
LRGHDDFVVAALVRGFLRIDGRGREHGRSEQRNERMTASGKTMENHV